MGDFDKKYNIVDEKTPPHELLSGHYKQSVIFYSHALQSQWIICARFISFYRSFAYYTLRERLPVILTQVVDNLSRDKDEIAEKFGDVSQKSIIKSIYLLYALVFFAGCSRGT